MGASLSKRTIEVEVQVLQCDSCYKEETAKDKFSHFDMPRDSVKEDLPYGWYIVHVVVEKETLRQATMYRQANCVNEPTNNMLGAFSTKGHWIFCGIECMLEKWSRFGNVLP